MSAGVPEYTLMPADHTTTYTPIYKCQSISFKSNVQFIYLSTRYTQTFSPSFPGKVPSDRLEKFLGIYEVNESHYENHYNYNTDNDGATVRL